MKILIIVIVILITLFILLQSYTYMSSNKTEEQKYDVILKEDDFEVRFYPSATIATIRSDAKTYKELSGPGFRQLAGYIFGGNQEKTSIAMTAPVHMDINDSGSTMSFVMPSGFNETNLPEPNDPGVVIEKTKEEHVAAIRFSGFASEDDLKLYTMKLQNILQDKGISSYGHFRYLGYNPPYQLIGRRNEIIVSVVWQKSN